MLERHGIELADLAYPVTARHTGGRCKCGQDESSFELDTAQHGQAARGVPTAAAYRWNACESVIVREHRLGHLGQGLVYALTWVAV
jgi:hypothetical protein